MKINVKKPTSRVARVKTSHIGRNASKVNYSGGAISGVTNVNDAIDQLAQRFFQSSSQPSTGVNEGDLWYDLTNSKLKNYDGSSWGLISGAASALQDTDFLFTAESKINSGYLAKFQNKDLGGNPVDMFTVRYDGVIEFKNQTGTPTAVDGGMYYKDDNLYIGVNSVE